jgi:hypothetical protein
LDLDQFLIYSTDRQGTRGITLDLMASVLPA